MYWCGAGFRFERLSLARSLCFLFGFFIGMTPGDTRASEQAPGPRAFNNIIHLTGHSNVNYKYVYICFNPHPVCVCDALLRSQSDNIAAAIIES